MDRRQFRQGFSFHLQNGVTVPAKHVGPVHFVDVQSPQIERCRNDIRSKIDHLDRVRFRARIEPKAAASAVNSQPRSTVGWNNRHAGRLVGQCFGNPVDAIEDVVRFHPQMQGDSSRNIQQSMAFQIFDFLLVRAR